MKFIIMWKKGDTWLTFASSIFDITRKIRPNPLDDKAFYPDYKMIVKLSQLVKTLLKIMLKRIYKRT